MFSILLLIPPPFRFLLMLFFLEGGEGRGGGLVRRCLLQDQPDLIIYIYIYLFTDGIKEVQVAPFFS